MQKIAPPYGLVLCLCLSIFTNAVFSQESSQTLPRVITLGENKPVMFNRSPGVYEGWVLELTAPYNYWAEVFAPDSSGWVLDKEDEERKPVLIGCNQILDKAEVTWVGDPEGEAPFHTWVRGEMYPCVAEGSGGSEYDPNFSIEILDGLVFLVEEESSTGIGQAVRIAAYKKVADEYGEVSLVPVEVDWSCIDSDLVFLESVEDEETGEMEPGSPLGSDNMSQTEVWVKSDVEDSYTVIAGVDAVEEYDYSHPAYNLEAKVHVYDVALVVDANRDLKIDSKDVGIITEENPWRFWFNDDQDFEAPDAVSEYNAPVGFDSDEEIDYDKYLMDGESVQVPVRDLTDFYPLHIDIAKHVDKNMDGNSMTHQYRVKIAKKDSTYLSETLKGQALFTGISPKDSGTYLTDVNTAEGVGDISIDDGYRSRNDFSGRILFDETARSNTVLGDFVDDIVDGDSNIVLVQHAMKAPSTEDTCLLLEVLDEGGDVVMSRDLPIRIRKVENMYAHIDLTGHVIDDDGYSSWSRYLDTEPENYPDDLTNDTRFVFVHGYNNNMYASRGANAENFKRLHLLGSEAKYIAVSWYGWQSQWYVFTAGYRSPEYPLNVYNAFRTAPYFADSLSLTSLKKDKTIVAAHSLGNMVVSSCIQDWNPTGDLIDRYFMLNAAVSQEAYGFDEEYRVDRDMIHHRWSAFVQNNPEDPIIAGRQKLFSFNWHLLFGLDDSRRLLTWSNRFGDVTSRADTVNLWSKGDRTFYSHPHENAVLSEPISTLYNGLRTFSRQEKRKGLGGYKNDKVGGWGVNPYYECITIITPEGPFTDCGGAPLNHINNPWLIPEENLIEFPYFISNEPGLRDGEHSESNIHKYENLFEPNNTNAAVDKDFRDLLLAVMIPSRLNAMGRSLVLPDGIGDTKNIELQETFQPENVWPIDHHDADGNFWDHGHFQIIALPYVCELYKFLVRDL